MASSSPSSPAALDAALFDVSEFSERLGPVLVKELRQGLRSGLFVLPFIVLPTLLAIVAVWALAIDNLASARNGVEGFFWVAVAVPVLLLSPMRALGSIRSEREAQTLDLLQLTPLTAWRIVLAKWSSLVVQGLLWVVALLPFLVLRYFFGGMNLTDELFAVLWLVLGGAVLTALCLVVSTLPRILFWLTLAGLVFFGMSAGWMLVVTFFSRAFLGASTSFWSTSTAAPVLAVLVSAHVIFLALTFAASRIAPPADNYAARLRAGTLALFGWFALASWLLTGPDRDARWGIFAFAGIAVVLLTAVEVVSHRMPQAAHVRPWARFGPVGRVCARAFLPGWPSAVLFFTGVAVAGGVVVAMGANESTPAAVMAMLLWPATLLPRALQCLWSPRGPERPGLHFVLHLAGGVLAGTLALFAFALREIIIAPAALFPSALWWLSLFREDHMRDGMVLVAIIAAIWILVFAAVFFWSSRGYWAVVAEHAAKARQSRRQAAEAVP